MKKLFSILFLAYSLFAMAEAPRHTFSGTVTDATNGESLIGASVTVQELPGTGITPTDTDIFRSHCPTDNTLLWFRTLDILLKILQLNWITIVR